MRTRIKICGITRLEDANRAVELGADALGFNFYLPSPRYIRPSAAREVICHLPPLVVAVGVFADETRAANIVSVAQEAGVDVLQLHGPRFFPADSFGQYTVIRALAIGEDGEERSLPKAARQVRAASRPFAPFELKTLLSTNVRALLLDTRDPVLRGGTGRPFNWKIARGLSRLGPIILAGGLTPDNVADAIKEVRPFAVDVASGVERTPGVKDLGKLRAFFSAVRAADAST